ncbi:MAG: excinuclease ABC subunit UvrA [Chitinispirillaceae bacterium]|nr:excinuclease ABC subunit UvrA [Chitinispirillaceae bacterium]
MNTKYLTIEGATQNNLKNLTLSIPLRKMTVITGVSGSGKSSLAFDTIYAEGQRRYVETFSSYARQFLDRMDRPAVKRIDGLPPAVAVDQTNPVRTSRSTVGTMTEINDHLKLLFARAAHLTCSHCGKMVRRDTPRSALDSLYKTFSLNALIAVAFPVHIPQQFTKDEIKAILNAQGYTRFLTESETLIEVLLDRIVLNPDNNDRIIEALENCFQHEAGRAIVYTIVKNGNTKHPQRFSAALHCADCDIYYSDPSPGMFSFNSPVGACETCRGFGRTIGIDYALVIPDSSKTLRGGAIKPFQTDSYRECQDDLIRFARKGGIPVDIAWKDLREKHRKWVLEGEGSWDAGVWYGVNRFFEWLESRSYKMHVRVLLSRYRAYHICNACHGARLKPDSLLWKLGSDSKNLHEIMLLPIDQCLDFFKKLELPPPLDEASELVLEQIRTRLTYLCDVGLGYLTLDRQSRTLSGGEVQRINLTTALGTSLVNTCFVLDEPSIGLHSRDINRLIGVLHKLRDTGNTLIIVEHDPEVIRAADHIIDMGPGPGDHGGNIVFAGTIAALEQSSSSVTAQFFSGKAVLSRELNTLKNKNMLQIRGAREHNLKNISVNIPLGKLVCISGVSGSGKSTLLEDIIYNGLRRELGLRAESVGEYDSIKGFESFSDIILVDQSSIGKTTRSNPVSFVGAFDSIRALFALQPQSKQRGYTAGTFSFNSGLGRCPSCEGTGFEHIEMQFLSDIYLRCPECNGKRFRDEILEINVKDHSIYDVLEMTVDTACDFFAHYPKIIKSIEPLRAVGLGYMQLGQPLPTLSGGESQRLKLAGHLAECNNTRKGSTHLFLFDEPTTGLHFSDIGVLLKAFDTLLQNGHSVILIEHNLDIIKNADWIIDMGPEGGDAGGSIIFEGTPSEIVSSKKSHTATALQKYLNTNSSTRKKQFTLEESFTGDYPVPEEISILNAREHNLKSVSVQIPRDKLTVITGVSGSGKSTLAFDIIFSEGRRRYLESLNAYARQFVQPSSRPDVDAVTGLPPTVAIEQRTSRGGLKSTVATVTEIYHFLRLLFEKLGVQYCPDCHVPIIPQSPESIIASIMKQYRQKNITILAPLVQNRKGIYKDLAEWVESKGYASLRVDGKTVLVHPWPKLDRYKEHTIELPVATLKITPQKEKDLIDAVTIALDFGKGMLSVLENSQRAAVTIFSTLRSCPLCQKSFKEPDPRMFSFNSKLGWCSHCYGTGVEIREFDSQQTGEETQWSELESTGAQCPACHGKRLNNEVLAIKIDTLSISDVTAFSVNQAQHFFKTFVFSSDKKKIAQTITSEIVSRLTFLNRVGLDYITLDRSAPSLSGGEAQRIRLAAQLGSNLQGVCYVLDEPTIGLHARDNARLIDTLGALASHGNTVVVVEHDEATIRSADHIIDLGPGGGKTGGEIVAEGSLSEILNTKDSLTAHYLKQKLTHRVKTRPIENGPQLTIKSASMHNLKNIDVSIPLERFVCVTGVSGSGKSTLVRDILYNNLRPLLSDKKRSVSFAGCESIKGWEHISRILEVDQSPIGKTSRSCPATYTGIMDSIRKIFASLPESSIRGYSANRFSFNTGNGRCPECEGHGVKKIEMNFLPDVAVTCEACGGARFTRETRAVKYKDASISDVLGMNINDAAGFFDAHRSIAKVLVMLKDTGLGYITLGQPSPTLSGGEAQRIKLVTELSKAIVDTSRVRQGRQNNHTLYILDEPTVGLHMADVDRLIQVLHKLVDSGNSVIVIEHNLDLIAESDWIIDLGPEGGDEGGTIIAEGTPDTLLKKSKISYTGKYMKQIISGGSLNSLKTAH